MEIVPTAKKEEENSNSLSLSSLSLEDRRHFPISPLISIQSETEGTEERFVFPKSRVEKKGKKTSRCLTLPVLSRRKGAPFFFLSPSLLSLPFYLLSLQGCVLPRFSLIHI